ncbi:Thiamine biosynthesis lipoprotein ApbE precursor [Raoultella terrigena]|nr:Thiamine biosynthesis lipoprotein ApbE precursor [Raoultella terrigena]
MDITFFRAALLGVCVLLSGCDSATSPAAQKSAATVLDGKTMGTFWRVSVIDVDRAKAQALRQKIETQLDADDRLLSTWKNDSALMQFNHTTSTEPWPVSAAMADIVTMSLRIGAKTHGAMDVTVGPLVNLWGFGPDKQPVKTPDPQQIAAAKARTGLQHLTVINRTDRQYLQKDIADLYVDLSTVGEGYAADHLARLMEQEGISRYLVSVGGALVSRGMNADGQPWRVAIQKPTDRENAVQAIVDINGHGISTSGSYRNYYELDGKRISHVIDPQTGRPIDHKLVSVTVIAPTALEADGWDTGLMVLGPQKAQEVVKEQGLAVYMIVKEGEGFKTWMSPQFPHLPGWRKELNSKISGFIRRAMNQTGYTLKAGADDETDYC